MYTSFLSIHMTFASNRRLDPITVVILVLHILEPMMTGFLSTLKTVVSRAVVLQFIHGYPILFKKKFKVAHNDL